MARNRDDGRRDFFISFSGMDDAYATEIDAMLNAEGFTTIVEAVDPLSSPNRVLKSPSRANKTLALISPTYPAQQLDWIIRGTHEAMIPVIVGPPSSSAISEIADINSIDAVGLAPRAVASLVLRRVLDMGIAPLHSSRNTRSSQVNTTSSEASTASVQEDSAEASQASPPPSRARPRAWICQYVPGRFDDEWGKDKKEGAIVEWLTHRKQLPAEARAGDPVIYWRAINPDNEKDRGGIVGTGEIASTEVMFNAAGLENFFPTRVREIFDSDPIPRDEAIERAGIARKIWQGSLLDLRNDEAAGLDRLLIGHGKKPLFPQRADRDHVGAPPYIGKTDPLSKRSQPPPDDGETQFLPDDAEVDSDELGRGKYAIALGRRLHIIWCRLNDAMPSRVNSAGEPSSRSSRNGADRDRAAFVMHLDAPWGGGKTTFANFVARVLNPDGYEIGETSFLRQKYGDKADLRTIFLKDPPNERDADPQDSSGDAEWPKDARRPWIVVNFNAWQAEHISPPWWVFYQTIRRRCLSAMFWEGRDPGRDSRTGFMEGLGLWCWLHLREFFWRMREPKVVGLLLAAALSLTLFLVLKGFDILQQQPGKNEIGFNLSSSVGFLLAAVTSITAIWGFWTAMTETLVPGASEPSERVSIGAGDPFERFRKHFRGTMQRLRRPVLVVIDDLDRCKPEFVVDLIRGIQTLLRSSRVVFLILGDRNWIELAFETCHQSMKNIDVGPEQTFGARFVEKAIQLSFVLPAIPPKQQQDYVKHLLTGTRLKTRPIEPKVADRAREEIAKHGAIAAGERDSIIQTVAASQGVSESAATRAVNEELGIRIAADAGAEREITHRLEPLAPFFPDNPRQIKRIINAVTIYSAVALQEGGLLPSDPQWFQLARWIIVMTEWPKTWRLLAERPEIADFVDAPDLDAALEAMKAKDAHAADFIREAVLHIRGNAALSGVLHDVEDARHPKIDRAAIEKFANLIPLNSRLSWDAEPSMQKN